ncbi:MAG TPA: histidine phosphatase family protein [Porticoccaceae bacterium]|nr:histidine phosphatase family protein [Porticoccaceae bacterium]
MTEIYFVRHGQASLGARNYDQLSPLGWEQARWLGEYFRSRNLGFDRVIVGDMRRHRETLASIATGMGTQFTPEVDARLNEFRFHPVMRLYCRRHRPGLPEPTTAAEFFGILRAVMAAWIAGDLDAELAADAEGRQVADTEGHQAADAEGHKVESWTAFNQRVVASMREMSAGPQGQRILVVSSGGPKSLAIKHAMGLSDAAAVELMMQIRNTALTRFLHDGQRLALHAFNGLAHMERPDREHSITMA